LNKWDFINDYHKRCDNENESNEEKINLMLKTYFEETSEKKFHIGEEYVIKLKQNSEELQKERFEEKFKNIVMILERIQTFVSILYENKHQQNL
jgi:hypothetical protein